MTVSLSRGAKVSRLLLLLIATPALLTLATIFSSILNIDTATSSHLLQHVLPTTLVNSLKLTLGVCVAAGVLGTLLAWVTTVCQFPMRRFFVWALFLPMAIPGYVMAFSFVGVFDYGGWFFKLLLRFGVTTSINVYSYWAVLFVFTLVLYPYVYMLARAAFLSQGRRMLEVGRSLGLTPYRAFFKVVLPMVSPWIAGGVLLVGMETLADFGTVAVFNYDTFTTAIYKSWFSLFSFASALQLAAVLLLVIAAIKFYERRLREKKQFVADRTIDENMAPYRLSPAQQLCAFLLCGLTFLFALVFPVAQLLFWAIDTLAVESSPRIFSYMLGSISLGFWAVVIVVMAALATVFIARTERSPWVDRLVQLSTLGYAIPGAVLAIGIYVPIALLDNWLRSMGIHWAFLHGSMLIMLMAYSVRFLAVAYTPIEAGFLKVTPAVDMASRSLGVSGLKMLIRVHLPIVNKGVLTAMVLVFVDVMKELPITLMTRPFGYDTLAVRVFELTSEGLWQRASIPALAIVAIGFVPVVLLILGMEQRKRAVTPAYNPVLSQSA